MASRLTREEADRAASMGLSPLGFLISIVNDVTQPLERRISCAQAILPYRHPRLSIIPVAAYPHLLEASKEVFDITPSAQPAAVTSITILPVPSGEFLSDESVAPTDAEVIDVDATGVTAPETDGKAA
jgi:hypothetical protein